MQNEASVHMRQRDLGTWPNYAAAALGYRNYWYPVTWSRKIGKQPAVFTMLGEPVMFRRENGKVYAFQDLCPHRGIPLSIGRQEFPGTWTCRYHGWTFDIETGVLKAAFTDGPDSPICGKVAMRTYSVEERMGLIWVWMGEGAPSVPVEEDMPEDFVAPAPGQFVQLLLAHSRSAALLPRPMSVAAATRKASGLRLGFLYVPVGLGTLALSKLGAGAEVEVK